MISSFIGRSKAHWKSSIHLLCMGLKLDVKVAQCTFEICKNNGFEHKILDYFCVLRGKKYHSGMQ